MAGTTVAPVVCLGCGCACDDIAVTLTDGRISAAERACPLGRSWFGDGLVPDRVRVDGADATLERAIARAGELLRHGPALVYLAPGLSTEAQRAAIAVADLAHARLDSLTSDTAAASILAGQRRGRATATLGEIRGRADLIVFWGVDPAARYPRFRERYTRPDAATVAVDIGRHRGPADAAERVTLPEDAEASALGLMRAVVLGRPLGQLPEAFAPAAALAERIARARYAAIVHDAEPDGASDPQRAEGLTGLTQALNIRTRCALSSLRGGGNRSGADSAITWQTGYPFAIDFSAGTPRYRPELPASELLADAAAVLVAGDATELPPDLLRGFEHCPTIVVGPRAGVAAFAAVAIDTGVAGIHEAGTAYRLDEVPLPLTPAMTHSRPAVEVLAALARALQARVVTR
jgi:formylmethanofuran dehydrogenase subunit B